MHSTAWELVQELPEEAVAESVSGLWAGSRREAIHEDARFWVLDSCVAPADESKPAAWSRCAAPASGWRSTHSMLQPPVLRRGGAELNMRSPDVKASCGQMEGKLLEIEIFAELRSLS